MSYRRALVTATVVTVLLAVCLPLLAQQGAEICIANGIVARIRDKGPYASVDARVAAIDKGIVEVISKYDTEHPQVSLKQKDGIWTVYCWDMAVIGVYPAEAEANNLPAEQLGALWVENFRKRLPLATPVSKMEDPFGGKTVATPATTPTSPETATATAETPVAAATTTTQPTVQPAAEAIPESAALLLIIDALRISRGLDEDEWIDQRTQIARNLLDNLRRFVAGKPLTSEPVTAPATTAPLTPAPATTVVTLPTTVISQPPTTEPAAGAPATTPTTATSAVAGEHAGDPAYAKVPQKQRIGRKFDLVKDPFYELKARDPDRAKPIGDLLKASRAHFTAGEFDLSEACVDQVLQALGIDPAGIK